MIRRILCSAICGLSATAGSAVWAHPGHGSIPSDQPAHWFEPVHALPILGLGALILLIAMVDRVRNRQDR